MKGIGRSATEKIYYRMLTEKLGQTATFVLARQAALDATAELYPGDQTKNVTVWNAFVACGICDKTVVDDCKPKAYPSSSWPSLFRRMFSRSSDLALLREYRDEVLAKTPDGKQYVQKLYAHSDEALRVLVDHPEAIAEVRELIDENRDDIRAVLDGERGLIRDPDRVIAFLSTYAEQSPEPLKGLAFRVRDDMTRRRERGEPFLGFSLGQSSAGSAHTSHEANSPELPLEEDARAAREAR
ncbi:MAG TPA: M4 family metallopeptidase [Thermoanaerobaculia bacterium]|nr:M4 family metallopeptidase [Thermoanaerobaculia bacterium]